MKAPKLNLKDPRLRTSAAILVLIILAGVFWQQRVYAPLTMELDSLNETKTQKQDRLTTIRIMKTQRDRLIQDIAAKRQTLDSLKSIFPDQKEIARLIQEVTRLARESNIYTTKFLPQPDNVREHYVESRYSITMWGGYHELAGFVSKLANLKLIINLGKVHMAVHPSVIQASNGVAPNNPYTVAATFDLTTFSSKK
jgi:type IV pilus assembly protein PilO